MSFFRIQLQLIVFKQEIDNLELMILIIKQLLRKLKFHKSILQTNYQIKKLILKKKINIQNENKSMILFLLRKVILFNFTHRYIEMSNKLQGIMQNKLANNIQERDGEDSDNSQQSEDYYQYERKKMQMALSLLKSKQNNIILQEMKKTTKSQIQFIDQFQEQVADLHKITRNNQKNVLQDSIIKEIKQKVFNQSMMHTIKLADQQLQKKKIKQQIIENQQKSKNPIFEKQKAQKIQVQNKLIQRMQKAKMERQLVQMGREDQRSMRCQQQQLSKFFSQRFFTPEIKLPQSKETNFRVQNYAPKSTFTNLKPLANTQNNVLPRNAPQLALRRLGRSKKINFAPSSISELPVKIKKLNPEQQDLIKIQKRKQKQQQKQQIDKCLQDYLTVIKPFLPNIESAGKNYRPKFINQFPNQNQQNFNIDNQGSGSKSFEECLQSQNPKGLKDIKLTFEHISNLKGIQNYTNIQQAALQFNVISNLNSIQNCKKLIQLNLSHNKIKNISSLKDLKWLRMLNIQHNDVSNVQLLGGSLEILYASHNKIQQITDLSPNLYLKRLRINNNNLHQLGGLKKLHYLQQIDAHNNYIKNLKGIQECILLRHLNVSNNRLNQFYPNFTFIFLNKLIVSGNSMQKFPNMFLPSLEQLYLDHNKIQAQSQSLLYFPNLKVVNFDDNKLSGFCVVFSFIRYSKNLETIKYDKNQYFMDLREKVRELYQHIIYRNMNKLQILNQAPFDIGIKKYYQGVYNNYLGIKPIFKVQSTILQQIQKKINFMIKQNQCMSKLEDKKVKFSQTDTFVRHKSVTKAEDLIQIVKFLSSGSGIKILHSTKSLFYEHDRFQYGFRASLHKIRNLLMRKQYRMQKRRKYFTKNKNTLKQLLRYTEHYLFNLSIRRVIGIFHLPLQRMGAQKAAIIIQKNWRCYRMRKRYLKVIAKLKKNKKEQDSDLEDIDLDEYDFDNMQIPQFNFQLPEEMDFDQYIIRPQIFQMLNKQQQKREKKNKQNNSGVHKKQQGQNRQQGTNKMTNNFIQENESAVSQKVNISAQDKKQQQIQRIMNQWGVTREAAQALAAKNRIKQKQKQKIAQEKMSAAQRYEKLKRHR